MERIRMPILIVLCIYMFTLLSCAKEKNIIDHPSPGMSNTKEVTFAVTLPGLSQNISTYAITEVEENKISTVDVLVFSVNGTTESFAYKARGKNIKSLTANSVQFQVSLKTHATTKYRFVVIANARSVVDNISYGTNEVKANVLTKLVINKPGVWNATSPSSYEPFPMWGENSAGVNVNDSMTGLVELPLLRSLARVDVEVDPILATDFEMTSVSVYNTNANGRVAPLANNYNVQQQKVTSPSLPAPLQTNSAPLLYGVTGAMNSERDIYLFEKVAAASANATGATALIIGGRYKGSSIETYYKLEFLSNAVTPAPLPLLRNHKYVFKIAEVNAEGYATKELALASKPSNMLATITTIDLNDMPIVYFDEHYYLAMQTDLVNYSSNEAKGEPYKIYTDHPGGWKWTADQPWLSINPYNDGTNRANISVLINSDTPQTPRSGTITIIAGKVRAKIKVYQGYGTNPLPEIP